MRGTCRVCGAILAPAAIVGQDGQQRLMELGQAALQHLHQAHQAQFAQLCTALAQLQTIVGLYVLLSDDPAFLAARESMRADAATYFSRPDVLAPVEAPPPTPSS